MILNQTGHINTSRPYIKVIQFIIFFIVIAAVATGLYRAVSLSWVSDDAFISFRCAQNLIKGNGLVYNAGERVEAYTNFLWTIIIAGGMKIGFEPVIFSRILSIFSFLATALIFLYLSIKLSRESDTSNSLIIPVAALAILLQYDFQVYATSGLETAWTTLLISLGFAILILGKSSRSVLLAGIILILAAMSRPDAMIFYIMAGPYLLIVTRPRLRNLLLYLIPLLIIYLPYWIIRYLYYGYPFPNSYYAKSASLPYYSQGLTYLWLYFKTYYILLLFPVALAIYVPGLFRRLWQTRALASDRNRAIMLGFFYIAVFLFYVARVGGDFMFARFLIPITPIILIVIETALLAYERHFYFRTIVCFLLITGILFRWSQFTSAAEDISGITDERANYPSSRLQEARTEGEKLKRYLNGLDVRVAFYGTKAMLVYYSELPYAIEGATGLTDVFIAHQPLSSRGRPGHEKRVSLDYMIEKKVNFLIGGAVSSEPGQVQTISFNGALAHIVTYENRIMDKLKMYPEVKFTNFPEVLDQYIRGFNSVPLDRRQYDFEFFKEYYFNHNYDPKRYNAILKELNS